MGGLLEIALFFLLFLGQRGRSSRLRQLLDSLPTSFTMAFEIESTGERLACLERRQGLWSVLGARQALQDNVTWVIRFRSPSVLRDVILMRLSLQQAFVERKMSLKGSIADTLKILKLFETLLAVMLPWEALVKRFSREEVSTNKLRPVLWALHFMCVAPFWLWKREVDLS